ncbi:MAG TPA: DUF418 domain-containing protein [Geothrix sp.]|nr:DUF418 domain-containing protein [Geothrix sp.]
MEQSLDSAQVEAFIPVREGERIQALDVVRGFALLGIFLMNIEWFNRSFTEMQIGLPTGMSGADWWASRLIYVLVQGKFWTLFSLLFGMGFAVMLGRAEQAGRSFLRPYLRRIFALAVFGALHYIFLWSGDILFSYAVAALALVILLYGTWKWILIAFVPLVGLGFAPHMKPVWGLAGSLAYVSVVALFLRGEKRMSLGGRSLPVFSFVVLVIGTLAALAAGLFWMLPHGPKEPRIPVTVLSVLILTLGILSAKFHQPLAPRARRLAVTLYLLPFLVMTTFGVVQWMSPDPGAAFRAQAQAQVQAQPAASTQTPAAGSADKKPAKTEAEKLMAEEVERAKRTQAFRQEVRTETQVLSKGTYREVVAYRAKQFAEHAPNEAGFATVLIGMFLLGTWFVRSGVMMQPGEHLPLFRKLAWIALPLGVGMGLASSAIATYHIPGDPKDGFQVATGLLMMGNLPACLGYMSVLVLMLHSGTALSKIKILAPVGRMALTNYLMQSFITSFIFFGYGLGHWGMGRARQALYVFIVYALQVAFSYWWLGKFRYGPMEWLWRAITYWKLPAMRLDRPEGDGSLRAAELPAP